jgi:4'-phosphopantetheinyl transferase
VIEVAWFEQSEADVPQDDLWLSGAELSRLHDLRFAKRRADWRLGRWTAKCALAAYFHLPADRDSLAKIELVPMPSGAPEAFLAGKRADAAVSLSHRDCRAACAISGSNVQLGCDLEVIEPRSPEFVEDYFTMAEQVLMSDTPMTERLRLLALLWSAKESALKALQEGLRLDTRSVVVCSIGKPVDSGWRSLKIRCWDGRLFHGWWQHSNHVVRTLVSHPQPAWPIFLTPPAYSRMHSYQSA